MTASELSQILQTTIIQWTIEEVKNYTVVRGLIVYGNHFYMHHTEINKPVSKISLDEMFEVKRDIAMFLINIQTHKEQP